MLLGDCDGNDTKTEQNHLVLNYDNLIISEIKSKPFVALLFIVLLVGMPFLDAL